MSEFIAEPRRTALPLQDGSLSILEWDNPEAAVLHFAHANGFNAETYKTLLTPLARNWHVIASDQRGHGVSTLPARPGMAKGWNIFAEDLLALADRLSSQPVILVGHSLGATASLMAAARAPEKVRALALIEPVLPPLSAQDHGAAKSLAERARRRRDSFASFDEAFESYRGRGIFATWPPETLGDYLRGGLIAEKDGSMRLACAPQWEAEIFDDTRAGVAALAGTITCPILILHGTVASTSSTSELETIRDLQPQTRIVAFEGAGHFLPVEQPDAVRKEVLAWLAGA